MALKKKIILPNGLPMEYHRVALVNTEPNFQVTILIHSYLDESGRQYEKDYAAGLITGEPQFPYVYPRYEHADFDHAMSLSRAYDWIKANLPEFAGAEDILEEDQIGDITGDEFIGMLEEVL